MDCAAEFFKFLCKYLLENRHEDMKFISKRVDKTITIRLEATASSSILRFSYTEAISVLQKVKHLQIPYSSFTTYEFVLLCHNDLNLYQQATTRTFETKPDWGVALTEEHLRYTVLLMGICC